MARFLILAGIIAALGGQYWVALAFLGLAAIERLRETVAEVRDAIEDRCACGCRRCYGGCKQ